MKPVRVLGAGAWGTALAILLARNDVDTALWSWQADHVAQMRSQRRNQAFLPDAEFPDSLTLIDDLAQACDGGDFLVAVPSHAFAPLLNDLKPRLPTGSRIVWATKGLEPKTGFFLHQVVARELGGDMPAAVVSGPSFAAEVAAGQPTAVTVASTDTAFAQDIAARLHNPTFRTYTTTDVTGVELGGTVKNVLAIAAGISDGLGYGANTRAALMTRGLAEMARLGVQLGGSAETFLGLSGVGDLILTCTDDQSRNRRFGLLLAAGHSVEEALQTIGSVVEGVPTADEIMRLARHHGIDAPIVEQVQRVLHGECSARESVDALLSRPLHRE